MKDPTLRNNSFTIGRLARASGLSIETIRYYERIELLPYARRNASGYRYYDEDDLHRLHFISLAKRHGFSLNEIRELLELRVDPQRTCEDVRRHARQKVEEINVKIGELERMRRALQQLMDSCAAKDGGGECPILEAFERG